MMKIDFKVKFYDYWHISDGASAGSKLDSLVVKDSDKLPYLPGKTIKGLARDMAMELFAESEVKELFGFEEEQDSKCYFSNATLPKTLSEDIISEGINEYLYDELAFTKVGKNSIAEDNSLREIEVVVPVELEGFVEVEDERYKDMVIKSLKMIKRVGLSRNRGLGRCEFIVEAKDE